jgi:hypothetical protein
LQQRTKKFHVNVIKLCKGFSKNAAGLKSGSELEKFIKEANELTAIFAATNKPDKATIQSI